MNVRITVIFIILSALSPSFACDKPTQTPYTHHVTHKIIEKPEVTYTKTLSLPVRETVFIDQKQLECMRLNMYFEARNQNSVDAMIAVGYIVMNRVASKHYPNTVCEVIRQGRTDSDGNYELHKCQFSWVCDGKSDRPDIEHILEARAWNKTKSIAINVLLGKAVNPIGNATMYHASYVTPRWARSYKMVTKIEDHMFYTSVRM